MDLMELPISDMSIEDGIAEVYTEKNDFINVRKAIIDLGYHITESDLHYFADNTIKLEGEDLEKFNRILDALQEDDDIDHVYHNVEE